METQFLVFGHKTDSTFDDRKHIIDCNEKDHKSCAIDCEARRQRLVEKEPGCEFIRLDPENRDIDVFRGIDKFHSHGKRNMIDKCNKLEENNE